MAQWIRLRIPSCRPGFESQAHHLRSYSQICAIGIGIVFALWKERKYTTNFSVTILCWNKTIWLDVWSHETILKQSDLLISTLQIYTTLKFVYDSDSKSGKVCWVFLKNVPIPATFCFFRPFHITISIIQIEKSIDGAHGIWTRCHRMVGADETTELWRPPSVFSLSSNFIFCFWHRSFLRTT